MKHPSRRGAIRPVAVAGPRHRVVIGGDLPAIIAGPCVIEDRRLVLSIARRLRDLSRRTRLPIIFKASFDKANRTSGTGFRGQGMEAGLAILAEARALSGLPITTDVHESCQVEAVAAVVDLLQVPAFLCRQTDLVTACARSGKPVSIKKGQFLSGADCAAIVDKFRRAGGRDLVLIERGNSFGYNRLVADMTNLPVMRGLGVPVIFDGTHSVQFPGGQGHASGGQGHLAAGLMLSALAMGCEGLFLETHPDPAQALSDGPNMIPLADLPGFLKRVLALHRALGRPEVPQACRRR